MSNIIQADYEALAQIAAAFEQQAEQSGQLLQRLQQAVGALEGGAWIGQSAGAFYREMEEVVLPAVARLTDALTLAGETTDLIATTLRDADQEASAGFRSDSTSRSGPAAAPTPVTGTGGSASDASDELNVPDDWLSDVSDWLAEDGAGPTDGSAGLPDQSAGGSGASPESVEQFPGDSAGGSGPELGDESAPGAGPGQGGASTSPQSSTGSGPTPNPGLDPTTPGQTIPADSVDAQSSRTNADSSDPPADPAADRGRFSYQAAGSAAGGGGEAASAAAWDRAPEASAAAKAPADQSNLGIPAGIAAASPFAALFGKALKDSLTRKQDDQTESQDED